LSEPFPTGPKILVRGESPLACFFPRTGSPLTASLTAPLSPRVGLGEAPQRGAVLQANRTAPHSLVSAATAPLFLAATAHRRQLVSMTFLPCVQVCELPRA
jgi:hypothetical protein